MNFSAWQSGRTLSAFATEINQPLTMKGQMSSIIQDAEEMIGREINKVSHLTGRPLTEAVASLADVAKAAIAADKALVRLSMAMNRIDRKNDYERSH
jgi:hypothetical protein